MTWTEIDIHEFKSLGNSVVIDVRESDEYTAGHIPGAVNIPLSQLTDALDAIPSEPHIHIVCQAGGRSARACEFLSQQARFSTTQFINVSGGTGAWILEGNDIVVGNQPH